MDVQSLQKMTVAQLREQAKAIPDVKGIGTMKKDELVALLAGGGGGSAPSAGGGSAGSTPVTKTEIKQRIRALKKTKSEALEARDKETTRVCNRQIHHFKHLLRKMAARSA